VARAEHFIDLASALAGVAISPAVGAVLAPAGKGLLSWWRDGGGEAHEQELAAACSAALLASLVRNSTAEAGDPVDDGWLREVAAVVGEAVVDSGDTPQSLVSLAVQGGERPGWGDTLREAIEERLDARSLGEVVDVEALVRDVPELLRQLIGEEAMAPDSALSPLWGQMQHNDLLAAIRSQPGTTVQRPTLPAPFMAPALPADLVDRPEQLAEVRALLEAAATGGTVGLPTALRGTGGFGKTTLASAVCHAERARFADGVLWVTLGEEPSESQLVEACRCLVLMFDDSCPPFTDVRAAGAHLGRVLGDRRILLVLDDAWRARDLEPFLQGGTATVRLITTRNDDVLPRGSPAVRIDELTVDQTTTLLRWGLDEASVDWAPLTARTGRWPVLVRLVNGVLRDEVVEHGRDLHESAAELAVALDAGPTVLDLSDAQERHLAVAATVELSLDRLERRLGAEAVDRYLDLGIFPEDTDVPLTVLSTWWGLTDFEVRRIARTLDDLSLLHTYDAAAATVRLHDVLRGYVRARTGERERRTRHARLLDAHRPASGRWSDLPDDAAYLWRWVAWHLHEADAVEELQDTVRRLDYLGAKIHHSGPSALLFDVDLAAHGEAELRAFVRRWIHLLARVPTAADVAATLLARPDVDLRWFVAPETRTGLRYASGWASPEQRQAALIAVLDGQADAVAWSPDGTRLVSAAQDGSVQIWDPSGADDPVVLLSGGARQTTAVAWSPDGTRVASAGRDGSVQICHPSGAGDPVVLEGHRRGVNAVMWSPDGARLASAGRDGTVRVWDPSGPGDPVVLPTGDDRGVTAVAWSPDGGRLAVAGGHGSIRIWDPAGVDGPVILPTGHNRGATAVTWSPDGAWLASAGRDGSVRVWDPSEASDPVVLPTGHDRGVPPLTWSPDGACLAFGGFDGTVRLWSPADAGGPVLLTRHAIWVTAVAWSPDGTRVASAGLDQKVLVSDPSGAGDPVVLTRQTPGPIGIEWSPDGSRLATTSHDGTVRVWDPAGAVDPVLYRTSTAGWVTTVAWSPDGTRLASASMGGSVMLWNPARGDDPQELSGHDDGVAALAWSPDGAQLASAGRDRTVRVWEPSRDVEPVELSGHGRGVEALAWAPDGARLASASGGEGTVRVWDPTGGNDPILLRGTGQGVISVTWSPDGARLVSTSSNGTLLLWDLAEAETEPVVLVDSHNPGAPRVVWSPDGSRLAFAGPDWTITLWNPAEPYDPAELGGHDARLTSVAWSPDGSRVASADRDGTVKLWDPTGIEGPVVLGGHADGVVALEWSRDAAWLASADAEGTVMVRDPWGHRIAAVAFDGGIGHLAWSPTEPLLVAAGEKGMHVLELVGEASEV
jgi:WD40 repeat protein